MSTRKAAQRAITQLRSRVTPSSTPGRHRSQYGVAPRVHPSSADKAAKEAADLQQAKKWNTYLKAISTLAFVASLAYLGAKFKGFKQAWDFSKAVEQKVVAESEVKKTIPIGTATDHGLAALTKETMEASVQAPSRMDESNVKRSPYELDVAKQVAVLEDRRALLMRQKRTYEDKIRRIEERQAMAKGVSLQPDNVKE